MILAPVLLAKRKLEPWLSISIAALFLQNSSFKTAASFFSLGYSKMHTIIRDSSSGRITVSPKDSQTQSALVVICHGLGDSAEGFVDVAEDLASKLPHVKFILPTAPTRPVTMNMGMPMPSWYDIVGLDERSNEKCPGIQESRSAVTSILRQEHESTGLPYNRMVLMGFSQGGALSLFTGMQLEKEQKLGGICVMSGYLPCAAVFHVHPGLQDTPILHLHGKLDPLVRHTMAEKSREYVTAQGATNYVLKSYAGLQHSVNMEELADVENFLKQILPQNTDFQMKRKDPKDMTVKELKQVILEAGLAHKVTGLVEKGDYVKLVEDIRTGKL